MNCRLKSRQCISATVGKDYGPPGVTQRQTFAMGVGCYAMRGGVSSLT
jgi:hypothetical protein